MLRIRTIQRLLDPSRGVRDWPRPVAESRMKMIDPKAVDPHVPTRANRILGFVEKYRYGPLATAAATGGAILTAGWTLWQALGHNGSLTVFLILLTIGTFGGMLVHSYLLHRSLARLQAVVERAKVY